MTSFKYLNIPEGWKQYYTKYPEGYTILEALLNWVQQVNDMVDNQNTLNTTWIAFQASTNNEISTFEATTNNAIAVFETATNKTINDFLATFDTNLQSKVETVLSDWQTSGFLNVVINEALQTQIDDVATEVNQQAKLITQFPRITPENDDSGRFQRALNSGFNIILEYKGNYSINTVNVWTSQFKLYGNYATITATSKTSNLIVLGWDASNNFVQVSDIEVEWLFFTGLATTATDNFISTGINIVTPAALARNAGAKNINIHHCMFQKFTMDIIATSGTQLTIEKNLFTNNVYCQPVSAGGYGVLLQACFDVWIEKNIFLGQANDRHAVYVSNVSSQNVQNENVWVRDNYVDWSLVSGITGFETCLMIRSCKGLKVINNTFIGGFGGADMTISNGDSENYLFDGNTFKNIRAGSNERSCIGFDSSSSFILDGLTIINNKFHTNNSNAFGATIASNYLIRTSIFNNEFDNTTFGLLIENTSKVRVGGNEFVNCSSAQIAYAGTLTDVEIYPNTFKGIGYKENSLDTIVKDITHKYNRAFTIGSDGAGNLSILEDVNNMVSSVTNDSNGVVITLKPHCKVKQGDFTVNILGSILLFSYNRAVGGDNSVTIGLKTFTGVDTAYGTVTAPLRVLAIA
jgi:hypothetical protein